MLRLFQVGNIRLHARFAPTSQYDYMLARSVESPTEVTNLVWTPKRVTGFGGHNLKVGSFSYSEILLTTEMQSMQQRYNQYNALTSLPYVDLFAYMYTSELDGELDTATERTFDSTPVWFHTTGTIKKVEPKPADSSMQIEIELQTEWESVNRLNWTFSPYLTVGSPVAPAGSPANDLGPLPNSDALLTRGLNGYWNRKYYTDAFYLYDPATWGVWHSRNPIGYPQTGLGADWNTNFTHNFSLSEEDWSGLTRSLYAFTNLPSSGGVSFTVTSTSPLYGTQTLTNTIALSVLSLDLTTKGYSQLLRTDILYIDDYQGFKSFVLRDGAVIPGVYPKWIYDGELLGQTKYGYNLIHLVPPETATEWAYLHCFRTV